MGLRFSVNADGIGNINETECDGYDECDKCDPLFRIPKRNYSEFELQTQHKRTFDFTQRKN